MTIDEAKKLVRGRRLRMDSRAISQGLQGRSPTTEGTFGGLTRDGQYIRVQRDGIKRAEAYTPAYWETINEH